MSARVNPSGDPAAALGQHKQQHTQMKRTLRSFLLLAVTAVMASTAQADPVAYNFSGTKIYGYDYNQNLNLGTTIVGTITLDPDQAASYISDYWWYGSGQYGQWVDGAFSIDGITDTGHVTGTALGGGTTYYTNYDLQDYYYYYYGMFSQDQIVWYGNSYVGDTSTYKQIYLYSYSYNNLDGDGLAEVADPWEPLADDYHYVEIYESSYNYLTGESRYGYTGYQLDSFEGGTPPDTTPPTFTSLTPSTAVLWPPNHQMVEITLTAETSDNVGVVSTKILSATSSEADNGLGDGDTAGDIEITGDLTLSLRAERSGKGSGRTYTITVETADAAGNTAQKTTTVSVPKSKGK